MNEAEIEMQFKLLEARIEALENGRVLPQDNYDGPGNEVCYTFRPTGLDDPKGHGKSFRLGMEDVRKMGGFYKKES